MKVFTLNESVKNALYTSVILDSIDLSGYEVDARKGDVGNLRDVFISEMQPTQATLVNRCDDWLRGLASACSVPFWDHEVCDWAKRVELLAIDASEVEQDAYATNEYWQGLAKALCFLVVTNGYL